MANGIDLEKYTISNDETQSDIACCIDLFDKDPTPERKHTSVVILMPVGGVAPVNNIFMENSRRKNWWPVEIWQTTPEWFPFDSHQNKYILVQSDEGVEMANAFYEKFHSSTKKNDLRHSSSICIVKTARGHQCSLYNIPGLTAISKELSALNAMGVATTPFAYHYAGNLKGIDISLITTVSQRLKLPLFNHVIGANKSESLSTQSISGLPVNR